MCSSKQHMSTPSHGCELQTLDKHARLRNLALISKVAGGEQIKPAGVTSQDGFMVSKQQHAACPLTHMTFSDLQHQPVLTSVTKLSTACRSCLLSSNCSAVMPVTTTTPPIS
jgi:hypothetical protein